MPASSITLQTHPHLMPADENLTVEQLLEDNGMDWTILRPTQFASNAVMRVASIRDREAVRAPYADTGLPMVHPSDIAAVARGALPEPGHRGRTYALTGPEPVTARQQVEATAAALGRKRNRWAASLTRSMAEQARTASVIARKAAESSERSGC